MTELIKIQTSDIISDQPDQNPVITYLGGLSQSGRVTMLQALNNISDMVSGQEAYSFPWHELRYQHTQAIKQRLLERGYKPATVNKHLCALRGVLKQCWLLGYITAEDYHKAAAVQGAKGETLPAGRELTTGEITALMICCADDPSPAGMRDAAIIALLYSCGLRRAEVCGLDLADVDPETGAVTVRGKGNKERLAYLVNGAFDAVLDWLAVRGDHPGALFHPVNKGGKIQSRRMAKQSIYDMLKKRAAEAGTKSFSPHDLRRTFVTRLLAKGADIATVSKMAGHASIETTKRYDRRGEDAKIEAATMLHIPYTRQGTK